MTDESFIWILFVIIVGLIFAFCILIVNYYSDSTEKYFLSTLTVSLSYTVSLLCALLIPVDIFLTAKSEETEAELRIKLSTTKSLYFYLYLFVLFVAFFMIPLAYFYGEERADSSELDIEYEGAISKLIKAFKRTIYFVGILSLLAVSGLIFRPRSEMRLEAGREAGWINQIFDVNHLGESAISFCFAILLCFGMIFWVLNASYGLTSLPVKLIRGQKSILETRMEIFEDLNKIREKYRSIHEKYLKSHTKISKADQRVLNYLKKKERLLSERNVQLDTEEFNQGLIQRFLRCLIPFRVIVGMVLLTLSGLILSSLALTSYDRLMNSKCKWSCGFIIEQRHFMNPVDFALVYASKYFPLDYLFFSLIVIYIFICSFYGIIKVGIRANFFKSYEIRPKRTLPQALLISGFIISFVILSLSAQMMTLSPQYTTFGSQKYLGEFCSLDNVSKMTNSCRMSDVSSFFNRISVSLPFFSTIFFVGNLCFLALSAIFLLNALFKKKAERFDEKEDTSQDVEITEATNLLNNTP